MSPTNEDNGRASAAKDRLGVLANLPRTRPQRASARRVAARKASVETTTANGSSGAAAPTKPAAPRKAPAAKRAPATAAGSSARPRPRRAPARARAAVADPAPIQGFECDGDRASGPVQPPGGSELAASAAEILGELTKAGFATGERLIKDVLGRLPLS